MSRNPQERQNKSKPVHCQLSQENIGNIISLIIAPKMNKRSKFTTLSYDFIPLS